MTAWNDAYAALKTAEASMTVMDTRQRLAQHVKMGAKDFEEGINLINS